MSKILSTEVFMDIVNKCSLASKDSAADNTSSFSDLLVWTPHPDSLKTARNCRLSLVAASLIGLETNSQTLLYGRISKIAHKFRYEGEWSKVVQALQNPLVPYLQLSLFLEDRTLNEFYGNDLKLLVKTLRSFKVYNPYLPKNHKVKYPHRKRGYGDKGHLRESWKVGAIATMDTYPPVEEYFEDKEYQQLPKEYKEKNNDTQRTLVEKSTSLLKSDLEGDSLVQRNSRVTSTPKERLNEQLSKSPSVYNDKRNKPLKKLGSF